MPLAVDLDSRRELIARPRAQRRHEVLIVWRAEGFGVEAVVAAIKVVYREADHRGGGEHERVDHLRASVRPPLGLAQGALTARRVGANLGEAGATGGIARRLRGPRSDRVAHSARRGPGARRKDLHPKVDLLVDGEVDLRKLAIEAGLRDVVRLVLVQRGHDEVEAEEHAAPRLDRRRAHVGEADGLFARPRVAALAAKVGVHELPGEEVEAERFTDARVEGRWRRQRRGGRRCLGRRRGRRRGWRRGRW